MRTRQWQVKPTVILTDFVKFNLKEYSEKLVNFTVYKYSRMKILEAVSFFSGEYPVILHISNQNIDALIEIKTDQNESEVLEFINSYSSQN